MTERFRIAVLLCALTVLVLCGCAGRNAPADGDLYVMTELLDDGHFGEYMDDDGTLFSRLTVFRTLLEESPEFGFFAYAENFIEVIGADIPDICAENYGTEFADESEYMIGEEKVTAASAIQVFGDFFSLFPMEVAEGRSFVPEDFGLSSNDEIPVILGSAYNGTFRPGDTFEAYYILERRTFRVAGIAAPGTGPFYLKSLNRAETYDRYIIMPFERIGEDTEPSFARRAVLLQQICGFLAPRTDAAAAADEIGRYLEDSGLGDWTGFIAVNPKKLDIKTGGR